MKVVTFGEIMLRLSPPDRRRIFYSDKFDVIYGGAESNVAASLAMHGLETYFVTKLPKNELGEAAKSHLRKFKVKDDFISDGGERIGIYFLETGSSQRSSKVIYDRKYSSISEAVLNDFNWEKIFMDADWFHFSGITPALGKNLPQITLEALKEAKKKGITVSCDLNYRKKLWTVEKASEVMTELMEYVDILIGNEEDAEKVFGIKAEGTDVDSGNINKESYIEVAEKLTDKFNFKAVAITLRESISATHNKWSAMLYENGNAYNSKTYDIDFIVDRVGGGDSFSAGLIYGFLNNFDSNYKLDFAVAASALKHSLHGDFNISTIEEIEKLAKGSGSGRVER